MTAPSLQPLLCPASVAVIGASTSPHKVGGVPVALLRTLGYPGRIVPVNPGAAEIQGLPAVPAIGMAGEIDLAIVCVPAAQAEAVMTQCAAARVKGAIMFTSGFAEMGAEGAAAQARIAATARKAGIALLGPNCLGVMSFASRVFATFSPAPKAGLVATGPIAMVSQSGAFGAYAYTLARKAGLGLSHWITTGNEAVLSAADAIEWLAGDAETRVILAYLEGCKDGAALRRALLAARDAGKPVVVTKVGRTAAGARAALSHTASLAGEDAVYDAVFEECGAVRAYTVEEFFRHGQTFAIARAPARDEVAIVTLSGGVGTLMADRAEDLSLPLPPFTAAEEAVLREKVPYCSTINPVDITGQIVGQPEVLATACRLASDSGRYGGIAVFAAGGPVNAQFWEVMKKSVADLSARPGTTVTCCGIMTEAQKGELMALGSLVYEEPTHAIDAFAVLRRHARAQEAAREVPAAIPTAPALPRAGTLNEAEALAWLAQAGVTPVPHAVAATAEEAAAIAERCAAPVAIKVLSRDLLHKTEAGGVRLGIVGPVAARAAFDAIRADVTRLAPQASFEGVLVARMVKPVLECMAGARFDPVFGPVVAFGLGGTDVEWVKRVAIASAPVTPERVAELLTRMDLPRRLDGWRGGPAIGIDALVAAIAGVGRLAAAAGPRLDSIEVNPLMVTALGVFAADAVVQIR